MILVGSEWAVNSVLVFDGIADSRRRTSAARKSTNAGSVAQLSIATTSMPCGPAAARVRSTYWPTDPAE